MIAPLRPLWRGGVHAPHGRNSFRIDAKSVLNRQPKGGRFLLNPPLRGAGGGFGCRTLQRPAPTGARQRPGLQPLERLLCRR